jgi:hypothetical protein
LTKARECVSRNLAASPIYGYKQPYSYNVNEMSVSTRCLKTNVMVTGKMISYLSESTYYNKS